MVTWDDAVVCFAIESKLINLCESSKDGSDGGICGAASVQPAGESMQGEDVARKQPVRNSRQGGEAGEGGGEQCGEDASEGGGEEQNSTYESRDDLSQNAVNRAFDVPPAVDEPDHDIGMGAFQRLLSEAEPDAHMPTRTWSGSDGDDELESEVVVAREYPDDADMSDDEVALVDK
ncbi:hypothetical protein PInf_021956 [Phytophthora infestans]|nr:hypothetical protein PInf_021956 [Phytophthora infestans]